MKLSAPYCVILTHRHGACMAIVRSEEASILKFDFINEDHTPCHPAIQSRELGASIEFFKEENEYICARVLGKTAENLAHLFQFACDELHIKTQDIKSFVVGTGPGSFTGLRLGCAFVNGIHLASHCELFSVTTLPVEDLKAYVSFSDLFYALHQVVQNNIVACNVLMPKYGREPSPVLNLRKE